ncbi:MAG: mycothiol system anti-sigma-R factor [Actinomycetota bacterium]
MTGSRCEELVGKLYQLLDGEITEDQAEYLQKHLEECGACLERLGVEMHFTMLLRARCRQEAACPDKLLVSIRDALHAEIKFE